MFLHRGEAGLRREERDAEHPRLRGATFTSKSDSKAAVRAHSSSQVSRAGPADAAHPAPSPRACTCAVYTTRGRLQMHSGTDALRRAAAAHICQHVLASRFHLFLEGRPGVRVLHWRS